MESSPILLSNLQRPDPGPSEPRRGQKPGHQRGERRRNFCRTPCRGANRDARAGGQYHQRWHEVPRDGFAKDE